MPRQARPKPLIAGRTESQVTAEVLDAARIYGLALERRNVGMAVGATGKPVRFGRPGDPDWEGTWPTGVNRGRRVAFELKHELFDPTKLRGAKAEHFARQLEAMTRLNESGGFAVWLRSGADAARVFARLAEVPGVRVEFDSRGFGELVWD